MGKLQQHFEQERLDRVFQAWHKLNEALTEIAPQLDNEEVEFVKASIGMRIRVMTRIGGYVYGKNPINGKDCLKRQS